MRRIFAAKGRSPKNPLIVHVGGLDAARAAASAWPEAAERLGRAFWPGPLTLVVPRGASIAASVTAGGPTLALRVPAHPVALALLEAAALPIAAPSANRSSRLSPTTADHVLKMLEGRIDVCLDAGPTGLGIESTIVDVTRTPAVVLRAGALPAAEVAAHVALADAAAPRLPEGSAAPAPGAYARHYAPEAEVVLAPAAGARAAARARAAAARAAAGARGGGGAGAPRRHGRRIVARGGHQHGVPDRRPDAARDDHVRAHGRRLAPRPVLVVARRRLRGLRLLGLLLPLGGRPRPLRLRRPDRLRLAGRGPPDRRRGRPAAGGAPPGCLGGGPAAHRRALGLRAGRPGAARRGPDGVDRPHGPRARHPLPGGRHRADGPHVRAERARVAHRRPHRPAQPQAAHARPARPRSRRPPRSPARPRVLRPQRLQALQRRVRPPGRRRPAGAPQPPPGRGARPGRGRLPAGRRRVLRPARGRRRPPSRRRG